MRHYQIAVLPGDGIGHEVIPESVQTLAALAQLQGDFHLDTQQFDWGSERYLREGAMMPKDGLAVLERGGFDGTISRCGACCYRYARGSTSTSTCGLCACYQACRVPWQARVPPRLT